MAASQLTLWRLASGTFGVICLSMMIILGILLKTTLTKQSIQPTFSPGPIKVAQEVSDCCPCQEKWIGYQCNCYFISDERKTWKESSQLCASQNSSLLQLQNSDELVFMNTNSKFYWTGLSSAKERAAWLWENGSAPAQNLLPLLPVPSPGYCIAYSPRKVASSELCGIKIRYICKQWLI